MRAYLPLLLMLPVFCVTVSGCGGTKQRPKTVKAPLKWADIGTVNHHYLVTAPSISDPQLGRSSAMPIPLRIHVRPNATGPMSYIGKVVYKRLFSDRAPFDFNVVFAAAHHDAAGRGDYANPNSHWYDVFFGFYEIDVPIEQGRPFGYEKKGDQWTPMPSEIVKLGQADWNYFSNHLYGVPLSAIDKCCSKAAPPGVTIAADRVKLPSADGEREWDDVTVDNLIVVGPGRSTKDNLDLESPHDGDLHALRGVTNLWRNAFGKSPRSAAIAESFAAVTLRAHLWMSFDTGTVNHKRVYRTFFFGGTVPKGKLSAPEEERFLNLQMQSLKKWIAHHHLGFDASE